MIEAGGRANRIAAGVALAGILAASGASAQDLKRPEEQLAAIYALRVQLDIEQRRLDEVLREHGDNARGREQARDHLARLYGELDGMVSGRTKAEPEQIESHEQEVGKAEAELEALTREGRRLREQIRETRDRIDLLQDRIAKLRKTLPSDSEALTGSWDVTFTPSGDQGVFTLRQSGTLMAGAYPLAGGGRGRRQGTI